MSAWMNAISAPPEKAGAYIVGNPCMKRVGEARYMPKKRLWIFPNAHRAFPVNVWQLMPSLEDA